VITSATNFFHHGEMFEVETPAAANLQKVVLVRPMAVTHQTDTEQRVIRMQFPRAGNTLRSKHQTTIIPTAWPLAPTTSCLSWIPNGCPRKDCSSSCI
jgi:hypothetical protein